MGSSFTPQSPDGFMVISRRRGERALMAMEMFEGGMKTSEISEVLGISQRMVQKDLQAAKKLHREMVEGLDQGEILGGEISFWLQMCRTAMRDYSLSQIENAKIGFLRVATEARAKLNKLLQDSGLMVKVPERLMIEEGLDFGDPEIRAEYLALLKKARAKGGKTQ